MKATDGRDGGSRPGRIRSAPATCPFFARHGFTVSEVRHDGHGPGVDLVVMSLDLARAPADPG
jgi:hypothetical protein